MSKKNLSTMFAFVVLAASCGTYAGSGAANGAYFGSVLGSAIGGLNNGRHGSDVGTIIGMAGGAILGAAIGDSQDKAQQRDRQQYLEEKARLKAERDARNQPQDDKAVKRFDEFNPQAQPKQEKRQDRGTYDDRIDIDFGTEPTFAPQSAPSFAPQTEPTESLDQASLPESLDLASLPAPRGENARLEIRNVSFCDDSGDGHIQRGESCSLTFEIINRGDRPAFDVEPLVAETSQNRHILVSPPIRVESLAPHKGMRYTARIVADRSLKNGSATFEVGVKSNAGVSPLQTLTIPTSKTAGKKGK